MAKDCNYENALLKQLPKELQEECRKVYQESLDGKRYVIQHKYNLGLLVHKAKQFEKDHPKQRGVVSTIQRIFHINSRRILDRTERLVTVFTKEEIDELTQVTPTGFCLCFTHFEFVMVGYLTKSQKINYLKYARQRGINPQDLYKIIKKDHGRTSLCNHKKKVPSSTGEFTKEITAYLARCNTVDKALSQVSVKELKAWKSETNPLVVKQVLKSLDSHLKKCLSLRGKLS